MSEHPTPKPRRYNNELPTDGPLLSENAIVDLANDIGAVIRGHSAIPRFREMVLLWWNEWLACRGQEIEFRRRCADHAEVLLWWWDWLACWKQKTKFRPMCAQQPEVLLSAPRLRDAAGSDEDRWRFDAIATEPDRHDNRRLHIPGLVPFELWSENAVEAGSPLPVPDCQVTLAEKYAALAAIHDGATKGTEKIDPFDHRSDEGAAYWSTLHGLISHLPESDEKHLRAWLREIERDLGTLSKQAPPKGGGDDPIRAKLPALKKHDRQAYQLHLINGMTQKMIAAALNKEHREAYTQGSICKMIQRAVAHADASGLADLIPEKAQVTTMDPEKIDAGERTDHQTPHQRGRRSDPKN